MWGIMAGVGSRQSLSLIMAGVLTPMGGDGFIPMSGGTGNPIIPGVGHLSITEGGIAHLGSAGSGRQIIPGVRAGLRGDVQVRIADGRLCLHAHMCVPGLASVTGGATLVSISALDWDTSTTRLCRPADSVIGELPNMLSQQIAR
jgi:hypothetical protein